VREGSGIADRAITSETTEEELVELLLGRAEGLRSSAQTDFVRTTLLDVDRLHTRNCTNVSFHIDTGEIVGLYGVVGCGREEVGRAVVGLHPIVRGTLTLRDKPFKPASPADALASGLGFLPSDRKQEGILANRPIRENLTLSKLSAVARSGFLKSRAERYATTDWLRRLGVKYSSTEHPIAALSGGNQQKVLFGRALFTQPTLLVLEDPTAGIDIGAKHDLYRLIRDYAKSGKGILWISSDLTEMLLLSHRIYAMYGGKIVDEIVSPGMASEERLLAAVLGRGGGAAASASARVQ
jgi:ribose transport system ATP-binding protein